MHIAIVGAGFAGLSSAKVLRTLGHDVTVFEKTPDVGGVWSVTRRYPGLTTQNDKGTYALSDHPMPASYPEWPAGAQVQAYLESYVERFDLAPVVLLSHEVVSAEPTPGRVGWVVRSRNLASGEEQEHEFDHLVVANGIFSEPMIPPFEGLVEFEAAGGRLVASGSFHELEDARGKDVVIVGYGKSSCDVSIPVSDVAASTTVVARELLWKMPKKLGGALNYKYLMLTRMGEALFRYHRLRGMEKFLHGAGNPVRRSMLGSVESVVVRQLKLRERGLVPDGTFEDIARSTVSLVTDGFYERVVNKEIIVRRDRSVVRMLEKDGRPCVELDDGDVLPADLVVCGTGFRQAVPFLSDELQRELTDERGNFQLYKQILPLRLPNLSFAGYNSSFFSPLSAEMAAVWIGSHLAGQHELPPVDEREAQVNQKLRWMEERTNGQHARGTNIIPFSMHNIDEVLDELGLNVGRLTKAKQWLVPVDPGSYAHVTQELKTRIEARASATLGA